MSFENELKIVIKLASAMKIPAASYLLFLGLCFHGCKNNAGSLVPTQGEEVEIDYEKEKAAIMEVISRESIAYWNKDFDSYASCWMQHTQIRAIGWEPDGEITVIKGWQERKKRTLEDMKLHSGRKLSASDIRRENLNIRISKEVAWLTFDEHGADTGDVPMNMPGLSHETRILEKHEGKWKIVYAGWLMEGE